MTTRRKHRFPAAVLGAALLIGGTPHPAEAAVPDVARTWATLMNRSLTANATVAQLRATLTTQRATLSAQAARVTTATAADSAAQARLTVATTASTDARGRHQAAVRALVAAQKALAGASKLRPRNAAATTRAQRAVEAATKAVSARKVEAAAASHVRQQAETDARAATTGLAAATAAWQAAGAAVKQTEQRIAAVGTPAALAGQAAAISRDVVTRVRPAFTVADTTTVNGVTVHRSVAYAFQRMLDDAKKAGVTLSGGGFRTKERQIELRKINGCPDVWTAPASSCRVPTAIPGRSLHEIGLAVDITSGGRTITAKSPAFRWLSANAGKYGFVNLPSEAWHWSITGS